VTDRLPVQEAAQAAETSSGLLGDLRRATAARHRVLDDALRLGRAPLTCERYSAWLEGSLRVLAVLEPALARWPDAYGKDLRVARLRADLRELGRARDPGHADVRVPASLDEAFGAAYVVEGSASGGRVLAPLVERALGKGAPTSYLRLRGDATQAHWQQWLASLAMFDAHANAVEREATCAMACMTFDDYTRALAPAMHVTG